MDVKGIPVSPLTGVLDTRSRPDALPAGSLRMRQNYQTVAQNTLRRGTGWAKLLDGTPYNNQDFHDQLLSLSGGVRQPITLAVEATSTRGVRSLFIATQSVIAQLNEYSGNWRIIGSGYGGDPVTSGKARRFKFCQLGDYLVFTNDFDPPMYHIIEENPLDVTPALSRFFDLQLIGLSRARVTWEWHNCIFFADVEMDGTRFASRLLWSNFKDPTGFDPAKIDSITGSKDLFEHEQILGGRPGLGNTFVIYTTDGMWEMSVVGGDQSYGFRRIYNGEENKGVATLKYPNTLVSVEAGHMYCAEDGIYLFNQYSARPERLEWLHRSSSLIYDALDVSACDTHIAEVVNDELLISVARGGAPNACPDITLRVNMTYKVADVIDHGFTAFCGYRSYRVPTIRDFIIENGICSLANLQASGYGFGKEGLPAPLPTSTAPFTPQEIHTATPQVIGVYDAPGAAKTVVEVSRTSNVATAKIVGHGLSSTNRVQIQGVSDSSFNTANSVITVVDADHVTYPNSGPNVSTKAATAPTVRLIGNPVDAVAIVLVNGTVTVKMKAHGLPNGQKVRVAAKLQGNAAVNSALVTITVLDADTFTYPSAAVVADTQFGAANITNVIPERKTYDWKTDGTPHFNDASIMQAGLIYYFVPGDNDLKLHLTGPNTDVTTAGSFTYDGAGIDLIGKDFFAFTFGYTYNTATGTPPAVGAIRFNNATPSAATHLYVERLDGAGDEQSQKLRDVSINDFIKVVKDGDPTIFHVLKVVAIAKPNNYFDFTFTYVTGAGTLVDTDAVNVSAITASKVGKFITAQIFNGLKVTVSTVGPALTPTSVTRNDPDNPDVVTMALTAHGLVRNNLIWIDGVSDASFDAYATKVVVIQNTEHPTFSVTDANHFTYVRAGNASDTVTAANAAARKLTSTNVQVEDWNHAVDSDSLCALLGDLRLDDICRTCSGSTAFVAASSQDWCLKQMGGVFYRERCANPAAVGTTGANGYTSSVGNYILDGYDSILRFSPMFTTAPGQPNVLAEEFKIFYEAVAQTPPSTIGLRVGISGQPKDPNVENCGIVWYQHSQQMLKCLSNKTEAQHKASNTQPSEYAHWNFYREGRYLMLELKTSGTGGDATFTGVVADARAVDAANY